MIGSNPFSNPQVVSPVNQFTSAASSASVEEEEKLVSRMHLDEQQRKIKNQFEEHERSKAQREAKEEKLAQKKVALFSI